MKQKWRTLFGRWEPELKNEESDEVDFLHTDKHDSFLQIDAMIFDGDGQAFAKLPKSQVCNVFTISKKRS